MRQENLVYSRLPDRSVMTRLKKSRSKRGLILSVEENKQLEIENQRTFEFNYRFLQSLQNDLPGWDRRARLSDFTREDVINFTGSHFFLPALYNGIPLNERDQLDTITTPPILPLALSDEILLDTSAETIPAIDSEVNRNLLNSYVQRSVSTALNYPPPGGVQSLHEELISLKRAYNQVQEELSTFKVPRSEKGYIYTEDLVRLDTVKDLTKNTIQLFIAQFDTDLFTKSVWSLIGKEARMLIDHDLAIYKLRDHDEDISLWETKHFLDKLDQLYRNTKVDTTTSDRLANIKWEGLYESSSINKTLTLQLLDIIDRMTASESSDLQEQKCIINRAWIVLSHSDKTKARLNAKVSACKTFKEFFTLLCTDRIEVAKQVDKLVAEGFVIPPKVYILTKPQPSSDRDTALPKDKNSKNKKESLGNNKGIPGEKNKNSELPPCNHCGRKGLIKKTGKPHTAANCSMEKHPDRNPDASILWKESIQGKAYASLTPPCHFLPYDILKDGSKREIQNSGESFSSCNECTLLSSLQSKFSKSTSDFLPMTITHVQGVKESRVPIKKVVEVNALIDSGSLAGDFISLSIIKSFDLLKFVVSDISDRKVCSGLDNSCTASLGSISLFVTYKSEVVDELLSCLLTLKILNKSPIDIIIGRRSIKKLDLINKIPSHFIEFNHLKRYNLDDYNSALCQDQLMVQGWGCQQQVGVATNLLLNATQTEIQVEVIPNSIASRSADSTSVGSRVASRSAGETFFAPCDDTPLTEPRVGDALIDDTPLKSLMASTQTQTLYTYFGDVRSYKSDDELIYNALYTPLHENATQEHFINFLAQFRTPEVDVDSHHNYLLSDDSLLLSSVVNEPDLESQSADSFAPWLALPSPN